MNINFRNQRLLPGYDFLQSSVDSKPIKVLVHEFIQNVVFTPFPQEGELQVERLSLAANIYQGIGFKKKAAFYRRFAALKAVTVQSDWQACYDSLIGSIDDFGLNLDPEIYEKSISDKQSSVWPGLHVQLIEELVTCCKKIQSAHAGTLAIRHLSFLFHTLEPHLSIARSKEFARELEELSAQYGEDSPVPLRLSTGFLVPVVNLTKYPLCLKFEPQSVPNALKPHRIIKLKRRPTLTPNVEEKIDNPFIFTPIASYNSMPVVDTRWTSSNSMVTGITWVQDEPCQTTLILKNTLHFELKVASINILSDGIPLETKPYSLTMQPCPSNPTSIQLIGVPRQSSRSTDDAEPGSDKIQIFGYSTHLLGVKSNCRLDMMPKGKFPSQYIVEVAPPLPRLEFQFELDDQNITVDPIPVDQVGNDLVVMDCKISVKINDKVQTQLTILNSSNVDVNYLVLEEKQIGHSTPNKKLVNWSDEVVDDINTTALKAGSKVNVPFVIEVLEEYFKTNDYYCKLINFEYSGGLAFEKMYCRRCAIKLTLVKLIEKPTLKEDVSRDTQSESEHV